jgi:anti-sigma factor RsiW
MREHPEHGAILDHVAGHEDKEVALHLLGCAECQAAAAQARRLLDAGRRAMAEPKPSRRAMKLAIQAFRGETGPSFLQLVFDSFMKPATAEAIRSGALTSRFLRFTGDVNMEIEIKEGASGAEVRGHLTPANFAPEVVITAGRARRRAKVQADGTFVFRNVPRKTVEIRVGNARVVTDL